jgi:hypothetical protein
LKVRDIERLLAANGIGKSKMDTITRVLRKAGKLPSAGRGANAPEATVFEAVKILVATAGSSKGVAAERRWSVLKKLRSDRDGGLSLSRRLQRLMKDANELASIREIRVARNAREASILFNDGLVELFRLKEPRDYSSRLKVEGVIPVQLLQTLSEQLLKTEPVPEPVSDQEEEDD